MQSDPFYDPRRNRHRLFVGSHPPVSTSCPGGATLNTKCLGWRHILVPLDFSFRSREALRFAVSLAEPLGARVSLQHVVVPDSYPLTHPLRSMQLPALAHKAQVRLMRLRRVLRRCGLDGEILASTGLPFQQILGAIMELEVDLLVITSHGRTGLKRLILGSLAETLLRRAPCPVLVVRNATREEAWASESVIPSARNEPAHRTTQNRLPR